MSSCPACGFENMRESLSCARCAARLVWDGPTGREYFRPPRGRRGRFARWGVYPRRRAPGLFRLPAGLPDFGALARIFLAAWRNLPEPRLKALAFSALPGGGQLFLREYARGALFLAAWSAAALRLWALFVSASSAFLHLATPLWGAALFIHWAAAAAAAGPGRTGAESLALRATVFGVLLLIYYLFGSGLKVEVVVYYGGL